MLWEYISVSTLDLKKQSWDTKILVWPFNKCEKHLKQSVQILSKKLYCVFCREKEDVFINLMIGFGNYLFIKHCHWFWSTVHSTGHINRPKGVCINLWLAFNDMVTIGFKKSHDLQLWSFQTKKRNLSFVSASLSKTSQKETLTSVP